MTFTGRTEEVSGTEARACELCWLALHLLRSPRVGGNAGCVLDCGK
jgi:hypothetical protein